MAASGNSEHHSLLFHGLRVLVAGGGGFIGSHLAKRLLEEGASSVVIADQRPCPFGGPDELGRYCTRFVHADLRKPASCKRVLAIEPVDWVFIFAADMGGMGFIGGEGMSATIMRNNELINGSMLDACVHASVKRVLVASSACVYPVERQEVNATNLALKEEMAWPAHPQDAYGFEKLAAEQRALYFAESHSLDVRIFRFHNVYGPHGTWCGGREKSPLALLRKALALAELRTLGEAEGLLEVWGDGSQQRSYCYIDDAVRAILELAALSATQLQPFIVNVGSEELVTVTELAKCALRSAGVQTPLSYTGDRPVGVRARNSDNTLLRSLLHWQPSTPLAVGLDRSVPWLRREMRRWVESRSSNSSERKAALHELVSSTVFAGASAKLHDDNHQCTQQAMRFGVLLPVTSRPDPSSCLHGLEDLARSLLRTERASLLRGDLVLFVGVDDDDEPLLGGGVQQAIENVRDTPAVRALLQGFDEVAPAIDVRLRVFPVNAAGQVRRGEVCRLWDALACDAFEAGCDYAVLLGDDVVLQCEPGWIARVDASFEEVAERLQVRKGFGCVCLRDECFPGFPTFPVIGRTHYEIFGQVVPAVFVNQDFDPFLYQVYRRWNACAFARDSHMRNNIGGAQPARYRKRHVDWRFEVLDEAVARVQRYLDGEYVHPPPRHVTVDVVVPSYRCDPDSLVQFRDLVQCVGAEEAREAAPVSQPNTPPLHAMCVVVVDDPNPNTDQRYQKVLDTFESGEHAHLMRVRRNRTNMGASASRNIGLAECAADWVVFLDDDVLVDPQILRAYVRAIAAAPHRCGFVGLAEFPPPAGQLLPTAVHLAEVTFFWSVARWGTQLRELPWGVTANLCVRRIRDGVEFDTRYPLTGGGEDVDYCLRKRDASIGDTTDGSRGFGSAPDARVVHPWWNEGSPRPGRFFGWANGDGLLLDAFPQYCYRSWPNFVETASALLVLGVLLLFVGSAAGSSLLCAALYVVLLEVIMDYVRWMRVARSRQPDRCYEAAGRPTGVRLLMASCAATCAVKAASEVGHLWCQLRRGRLFNVCRRFHWFAHCWPHLIEEEKEKARIRFAVYMVGLAGAMLH
mmetsp:Transcript_5515/g.16851  ORF Transcript_5515/g.16851 Transcript_5515/m.16851 type:complete len:1085 (-) Transcript_5515:135-3389(-)|eukprot:CAMPEP_0174244792 /NCGR_PEP_ID=MMETSP0417-20130205/36658_1 /TAXON_ID=242541 /ORGANISM="Mayorella sp, Strain BSH-02190019" /LENGTH=1084 /DNA_ID=CAMNT_0015324517 /DNA_START=164 /DNA_END=3418 /DNA_ORIENTATION=+